MTIPTDHASPSAATGETATSPLKEWSAPSYVTRPVESTYGGTKNSTTDSLGVSTSYKKTGS